MQNEWSIARRRGALEHSSGGRARRRFLLTVILQWVVVAAAHGQGIGPAWTFEGDRAAAHLGFSVASAGDVDGDGFADVIVGAPGYDGHGAAFLFLGSAAGLAPSPSWSKTGAQPGASFGYAVASAGDVNGDGYDDVLVGAPDHDDGEEDEGAAFLYLGAANGLASAPARIWQANSAHARFGAAVGSAGDVDGSGFDDVLIGAPGFDGDATDEGAAYLFLGAATLPLAPAWVSEGNQAGAELGTAVAKLGDLNGDGFDDVAVGAPLFDGDHLDEGQVRVFAGAAAGLGASPLQSFETNAAGGHFGFSVAGGGDLNGGGVRRILFGAPIYAYTHMEEGGTFLGALGQSPFFLDFGRQDFAHRGASIASAGDVNADGLPDVVIGADRFDSGDEDEGRVTLHLGHSGFVVDRTPAWVVDGNQADCRFGSSVAGAGDVNGDGFADVLVGAPHYHHGESDEGRAFLYLGPSGTSVGVDGGPREPGASRLGRPTPNPFRSGVQVTFAIAREGRVQLSVLDVGGRQRALLANGAFGAGPHTITWSGRDDFGVECPAGVYFLRLAVDGGVAVRRVLRIP